MVPPSSSGDPSREDGGAASLEAKFEKSKTRGNDFVKQVCARIQDVVVAWTLCVFFPPSLPPSHPPSLPPSPPPPSA